MGTMPHPLHIKYNYFKWKCHYLKYLGTWFFPFSSVDSCSWCLTSFCVLCFKFFWAPAIGGFLGNSWRFLLRLDWERFLPDFIHMLLSGASKTSIILKWIVSLRFSFFRGGGAGSSQLIYIQIPNSSEVLLIEFQGKCFPLHLLLLMKQKIGEFFVSYFLHFILRLRVLHAGIRILLDFYVVGFSTLMRP